MCILTFKCQIGYYHLSDIEPRVLDDTDFESYKGVFSGAWSRILHAVGNAERYGLGVLIGEQHLAILQRQGTFISHLIQDLHAAPGAQNKDAHSGTGTGEIHMWTKTNMARTVMALQVLTTHFANRPNVVGIELINEPANNNQVQGWYESTLATLRKISPDIPLYIR